MAIRIRLKSFFATMIGIGFVLLAFFNIYQSLHIQTPLTDPSYIEYMLMNQRISYNKEENGKERPLGSSKNKSCLTINSLDWLSKVRHSNVETESMMKENFVSEMITNFPSILSHPGKARPILHQALSFNTSRFVDDAEDGQDDRSIKLWVARLSYLALHYHQHKDAIPEAKLRVASTQEELASHHIGRFDFECPNAKFVVIALADVGIGSNMRNLGSLSFLFGLATNRTVLFLNNVGSEDKHMYTTRPWQLVSCPRKDHQCFFLPLSPCVLTLDDINNATHLPRSLARTFIRKGKKIPDEYQDAKVWFVIQSLTVQALTPPSVRKRLAGYCEILLSHVPENDKRLPAMKRALELMAESGEDEPRNGYNYALARNSIQHPLVFYALRPLPEFNVRIDNMLNEILPAHFDPNFAVGLPVRASDKCIRESECLSFSKHMQAALLGWEKLEDGSGHNMKNDPFLVFTTESTQMVKEQQEFAAGKKPDIKTAFNFSFVTNSMDITPNTGKYVARLFTHSKDKLAEEENLLSMLSSFKLQMTARISIANCCSNFHALLGDYLYEGTGKADSNEFMCLQEFENPELKICCSWHHDCIDEKRKTLIANNQTDQLAVFGKHY